MSNKPLDDKQIEIIEDRDRRMDFLTTLSGVMIAFSCAAVVLCYMMVNNLKNNDQAPVVACPKSFDLDAPVTLKPLESLSAEQYEKHAFGFVRRFVTNQYPRSSSEVEASLSYLKAHSKGEIARRWLAYEEEINNYKRNLDSGKIIKVYPINGERWRISKNGSSGFIVEFDAWVIRENGVGRESEASTVRYLIEKGPYTVDNPEGLYVMNDVIETTKDPVSGESKYERGF